MISAILLIIALLLFLSASVSLTQKINLTALGLAAYILALLLGRIPNLP